MSICIIFNPSARGEKALKFRRYLEEVRGDWALKPTTGPGAARQLAAEAVRQSYETILAAGGDGTLNEVLNGIADAPDGFSRARLGVLPLGTMNVFARELNLPLDIKKIWPVLERGRETRIDVGRVEFQKAGALERRCFVQLAGAGFDARSVELVNWEVKKKYGIAAYFLACLQAIQGPQSRITITNGAETATGEAVLVGNGKFYGGSFPIFHKSDLQDGQLDAVILDKISWQAAPRHCWDFASGRMFKDGCTSYLRGQELTLSSPDRSALQLEGELAGELPARFTVLPRSLRVIIP